MKIPAIILLFSLCAPAFAQSRHDPLNTREVEQMRENAQDPKKRVDLLLSFANERVMAIERLRTVAKPSPNDPDTLVDLLTDLAALIDELDDNLAMYNNHSEDLRKPLHRVLDAEAQFQKKLAELGESSSSTQRRRFAAALEDAADSLAASTESARAMLADQIAKKGEAKENTKQAHSDKGHQQEQNDPTGFDGTPPER
jgi:hypothetical protein